MAAQEERRAASYRVSGLDGQKPCVSGSIQLAQGCRHPRRFRAAWPRCRTAASGTSRSSDAAPHRAAQHRVSYTYGHVFPAPVERPSSPVDPPAQPLKLFPAWSRARAIPLALVGVSLIAVLEGVYIWRTMRHSSGTLPKPPETSQAAAPQVTDSQAAAGTAQGTSDKKAGALSSRTGRLVVRSEPPGAQVSIDGRARGVTPLTLANLSPGEHRVVLKANGSEVQQTVRVEAGATVSVVAPLKPKASASGWIAIESPVEVDVFADGALVGTSRSPKILLQEGEHTLVLINEEHWISREAVCAGECGHTGERRCDASGEYDSDYCGAVGRSVGGRQIGGRDADRKDADHDRSARSRVPASGARRENRFRRCQIWGDDVGISRSDPPERHLPMSGSVVNRRQYLGWSFAVSVTGRRLAARGKVTDHQPSGRQSPEWRRVDSGPGRLGRSSRVPVPVGSIAGKNSSSSATRCALLA